MERHPVNISIDSAWGITVSTPHIVHTPRVSKLVVLFPGEGYSCSQPLLYYATKIAFQFGCDVLIQQYGFQAAKIRYEHDMRDRLISETLSVVRQAFTHTYGKVIFISKSLGTIIAGEVAQKLGCDSISHVYLTPVRSVIPHINASRGFVLVGSLDPIFKEQDLIQIQANPDLKIRVFEQAEHSLEVVDDFRASIEILKEVSEVYASMMQD